MRSCNSLRVPYVLPRLSFPRTGAAFGVLSAGSASMFLRCWRVLAFAAFPHDLCKTWVACRVKGTSSLHSRRGLDCAGLPTHYLGLQNRNGCGDTSELRLLKEQLGLFEEASFGLRLGFGPRGAGINSCYRLSCPGTNNLRRTRLASLVCTGHLHWNREKPFFGRSLTVRLSLFLF